MTLLGYIDPGLGALMWQTAVAAFVGFMFYLKKTRRWIVNTTLKIFGRGQKSTTVTTTVTAEIPATKVDVKTDVR